MNHGVVFWRTILRPAFERDLSLLLAQAKQALQVQGSTHRRERSFLLNSGGRKEAQCSLLTRWSWFVPEKRACCIEAILVLLLLLEAKLLLEQPPGYCFSLLLSQQCAVMAQESTLLFTSKVICSIDPVNQSYWGFPLYAKVIVHCSAAYIWWSYSGRFTWARSWAPDCFYLGKTPTDFKGTLADYSGCH